MRAQQSGRKPEIPVGVGWAGVGERPEAISVVQIRDNESPKSAGGRESKGSRGRGVGNSHLTGSICSGHLWLEGWAGLNPR